MYRNDETPKVTGGKLSLEGLNCLGIGFAPMPGNVGRFPLLVTINGETHRRVLIEDTGIYLHRELIRTAEVDVNTLGGGVDGDRWRLTRKEAAGDGREARYPTDERGRLIIAPSGGEVLFNLSSPGAAFDSVFDNWDGETGGVPADLLVYDGTREMVWHSNADGSEVRTVNPDFLRDVSRFTRLVFVVEQYYDVAAGASAFANAVHPFVAVLGPEESFTSGSSGCRILERILPGSAPAFGGERGGITRAVLEMGVPAAETASTYQRVTPRMPPLLAFGLHVEPEAQWPGGSISNPFATRPDYRFRMWAVGY
jgi:hypothetical protein